VESALAEGSERLDRRSRLKAAGYDFERIAERVAVIRAHSGRAQPFMLLG
jgi:hypothetical protein